MKNLAKYTIDLQAIMLEDQENDLIRRWYLLKEETKKISIGTMFIALLVLLTIFGVMVPMAQADSWNSILRDLNLNNCRITQDEDSHIKKGNGSMYAIDIACVRWKEFSVYTPNNRNIYLLEKIWYDKRLWNFIVLRHWDLRWVYWHTTTNLHEWYVFKWWELLWKTNISWISQNYHLHIELWAYKSNIRFDYLKTKKPTFNPKSFDLRMQRNIVSPREINEKILDFIDDFEGVHLKAYWDISYWSVWYGTHSYKWEVITLQQAKDRARIEIQSIRERYSLYKYSLNTQKAIVSFVYNIWSLTNGQQRKLKNWYYRALWNDFKQYNWFFKRDKNWNYILDENWNKIKVILKWLVKRRAAETNLL